MVVEVGPTVVIDNKFGNKSAIGNIVRLQYSITVILVILQSLEVF